MSQRQLLATLAAALLLFATAEARLHAQCDWYPDFPFPDRSEDEPDLVEPIRPVPGLAADAWLDKRGIIVNGTNDHEFVTIAYSVTYREFIVIVQDSQFRIVLWKTFDIDIVRAISGSCYIFSHDGNDDVLIDVSLPAVVYAGGGDDRVTGGYSCNQLYGESGSDILYGNDSIDRLYGGPDDDLLVGKDGIDQLFGGPGDDYLDDRGDPGARGLIPIYWNRITGGPGRDTFRTDYPWDFEVDFDPIEDISPLASDSVPRQLGGGGALSIFAASFLWFTRGRVVKKANY